MKNSKIQKIFLYLLNLAIIFCFFSVAEPALAFTITPAKATYFIDPGKSASGFVKIINSSQESKIYDLSIIGARSGASGYPEFGTNFDLSEQWLKLSTTSITVGAEGEMAISYIASVPAGAAPGAHYAGIAIDEKSPNQSGVGVTGRLINIIYIQVAGLAREEVVVTTGEIITQNIFNKNRVWHATINNTGNIPVSLKAVVVITNSKKINIFSEPVNAGNQLIPGSVRNLNIPLSFAKANIPGFYRVNLNIEYGNGRNLIFKSILMFYSPVWFLISVFLVITIIIILIIYLKIKKHSKKTV